MSEKNAGAAALTADAITPAARKAAKKKTAAPQKALRNEDFCVYLGPTMIGVIQRGTIYRGSRDAVLRELAAVVEKYPLVASLVVGSDTLPEDRVKVKTPGNLLYVNYHRLAEGKK